MPLFVIAICGGRRVGWISLVFVLSSDDVHMCSSIPVNYNMADVD